jgi:uncharacterized protein YeaO (DUF488 family)
MIIQIKRVYDIPVKKDYCRILIERRWPRGTTKEEAAIDEWVKELAPTEILMNWFDYDPNCWQEFHKRYKKELKQNTSMEDFIKKHKEKKVITLLYSTKYDHLTHAIILKQELDYLYCNPQQTQ